jgi:hypothetical protein
MYYQTKMHIHHFGMKLLSVYLCNCIRLGVFHLDMFYPDTTSLQSISTIWLPGTQCWLDHGQNPVNI